MVILSPTSVPHALGTIDDSFISVSADPARVGSGNQFNLRLHGSSGEAVWHTAFTQIPSSGFQYFLDIYFISLMSMATVADIGHKLKCMFVNRHETNIFLMYKKSYIHN